jgi:hypothetical protein
MSKPCGDCEGTGKMLNPSYDEYSPMRIRCTGCFGSGRRGRLSNAQRAEREKPKI